jgi:sRNA-binding carbon storage regulator CsrA
MSTIKNISLYIPHVFPNFDKDYVTNAFNNIGEVSRVDFIAKVDRNGNNYNALYVHFNKWYTNGTALQFYFDVIDERKEARLYHDAQWYWIVLPNTTKKYIPGERKTRIDIGDLLKGTVTPVKKTKVEKICQNAPKKIKIHNEESNEKNAAAAKCLLEEFEEVLEDDDAQMAEIEAFMEEEDKHLVSIDGRYVAVIEQENMWLRYELNQLRNAVQMYQTEAYKGTAVECEN